MARVAEAVPSEASPRRADTAGPMVPTQDDMARAVARALSLYERARGGPPSAADGPLIARRLARWRDTAANGDETGFRLRLVEDGFAPDALAGLLGDAAGPLAGPLPEWAGFIRDALAAAADWSDAALFETAPESGSPPFHALVRPFSAHAYARLIARRPELAEAARWASLASARATLVHQLASHAAFAFQLEFAIFKSRHESALEAQLRRARGERSDRLYRAFVRSLFDGGWPAFIVEYAVLARQIAVAAINWVDAVAELLDRLDADHDALATQFNGGRALGAPESLTFGLSDRHNGGRSTAILRWPNGVAIVYKPKPLDTDLLMNELIGWINAEAGLLPMAILETLTRATHGWQAYVATAPCADAEAAARFYQRSGYLLALAYALEAYDCHHENLVARGEHPYLIDTETIFNPYKEMDAADEAASAALRANEAVFYSVIRTGMLPNWSIRADGSKRDTSGFGGAGVAGNDDQSLSAWVDVDSDDIRLEPRRVPVAARENQPTRADGTSFVADDHVADILAGFEAMYRFLMRRRAELAGLTGRHKHIRVRFVRKATNIYVQQLWQLSNAEFLRSGVDWSIEADHMARLYLAARRKGPVPWGLLRAEHEAMIGLDVPYFRVRADGLDIADGAGTVRAPGYFTSACLERLGHKLDRLDEADLALQRRYIAYAFYARAARSYHDDPDAVAALSTFRRQPTGHLAPIADAECRAIADEIAGELEREAVRGGDGSAAWIALEYIKDAETFQFKPISFNLYSGAIGLAVFLAALARSGGRPAPADLAAAAARPVIDAIGQDLDSLLQYGTVGGGNGLGSAIYGLASVASFLPDHPIADEALAAARRCAARIDDALLSRDRKHDLIFGGAGLVLGLAKLHRVAPDDGVAEKIALAAGHLLASRVDGIVCTYGGKPITGMSHGTAGVALALMRAYAATGDSRCRVAAMEHVAWEEARFDAARGNYPDYRSTASAAAFLTCWCHGAPGIGLSRLAMRRIAGDDALTPQIERAMRTTNAFTLDHVDHLCCGNMGRIDIQIEWARARGDQAAIETLRRDAAYVVARYRSSGSFRLVHNSANKVFAPGLFTGAAGIAYGLLRLADPTLPCVLAYD